MATFIAMNTQFSRSWGVFLARDKDSEGKAIHNGMAPETCGKTAGKTLVIFTAGLVAAVVLGCLFGFGAAAITFAGMTFIAFESFAYDTYKHDQKTLGAVAEGAKKTMTSAKQLAAEIGHTADKAIDNFFGFKNNEELDPTKKFNNWEKLGFAIQMGLK